MSEQVTIKQLFVYPVKSLAGIAVQQWPLLKTGLKHDRQFMLINEKGVFLSQRTTPQMACIKTAIEDETLTLSHAEYGSVSLPLNTDPETCEQVTGRVWRDDCECFEPSQEVSAWLTQVLGKSVRLVTLASPRPQSNPERFGEDTHTQFADAAPYLIANQSSLDALNKTLIADDKTPVDIRRFRPNIVIESATTKELDAFSEHQYSALTTEELTLKLIDHCERCIMTTVDPDTGIKDAAMEPFKTLVTLNPMPNNHRAPAFAVNASLISAEGTLAVGDNAKVD